MALKSETVFLSEIAEERTNRIDCGFYFVKRLFARWHDRNFHVLKISELTDYIISGNYIDTYIKDCGESIPYVRVASIKHHFLNQNRNDFVFVSKNIPEKIKVKENDILVGRTAVLGIASLVDKFSDGYAISQHITKIKFKNLISVEFALAYLNSGLYKKQMLIASSGTSRHELTHSQLGEVNIIIPENAFEEKIKGKIQNSVMLHTKSMQYIEKAQNLLYKKIDVNFAEIPKEKNYSVTLSDIMAENLWTPAYLFPLYINTLKAIQSKWPTIPLGEFTDIKKGSEIGSDNYTNHLDKKDNDIPFVRTSDIINYEADLFPDFYIPHRLYGDAKQDLRGGDVLFTKDGKIGMSAMITKTDKIIIASGIVRIRLGTEAKTHNLTPEYVFTLLSLRETGFYPAIRRTVTGSTIPHLKEGRLKEIEIPIMDKNSIEEITNITKRAFDLKDRKKHILAEIRKEMDSYFFRTI